MTLQSGWSKSHTSKILACFGEETDEKISVLSSASGSGAFKIKYILNNIYNDNGAKYEGIP